MKWLLTLLAGIALGAAGLFIFLRQVPADPAPVVVVAPPALPPAPAPAPAPSADPLAGAPGAPVVTPDLHTPELAAGAAEGVLTPAATGAATGAAAGAAAGTSGSAAVAGKLLVPVEGIKAAQLTDTYHQPRGSERQHEALDIMAPKGAKVIAVNDGKVAKLFNSKAGGLTVYQFDPGETHAYYYAHLDRYAEGIKEGMQLKRGDLVGYVGVTGNSDPNAPHLHFAVFELPPEKQWWKGRPINPFPLIGD